MRRLLEEWAAEQIQVGLKSAREELRRLESRRELTISDPTANFPERKIYKVGREKNLFIR